MSRQRLVTVQQVALGAVGDGDGGRWLELDWWLVEQQPVVIQWWLGVR